MHIPTRQAPMTEMLPTLILILMVEEAMTCRQLMVRESVAGGYVYTRTNSLSPSSVTHKHIRPCTHIHSSTHTHTHPHTHTHIQACMEPAWVSVHMARLPPAMAPHVLLGMGLVWGQPQIMERIAIRVGSRTIRTGGHSER